MAKVTIKRAGELVGKNASTIHRAMEDGRLSFEKNSAGARVVEISELERVFGLIPQGKNDAGQVDAEVADLRSELTQARRRIQELEEDRTDLRAGRDRLLQLLEQQGTSVKLLTDQRKALEEDHAALRAERERLLGMVEDLVKRPAPPAPHPEAERGPFGGWRWAVILVVVLAVVGAVVAWKFQIPPAPQPLAESSSQTPPQSGPARSTSGIEYAPVQ